MNNATNANTGSLNKGTGAPYSFSTKPPPFSQSNYKDSNTMNHNNGKISNANHSYTVQNNMINTNVNEYKVSKIDLNNLKEEMKQEMEKYHIIYNNNFANLMSKVYEMNQNVINMISMNMTNNNLPGSFQKNDINANQNNNKNTYDYDDYEPPEEFESIEIDEVTRIIQDIVIPNLLGTVYDEQNRVCPIL
jgi:hypothetical protein